MKIAIQMILNNFPLMMLIISLVVAFSHRDGFFNRLLFSMLILNVGLCGIWGFIMHGFFSDLTSNYIGWTPSPFEYEVAIANLGIGITGIIAAFSSHSYKKSIITFVSIFLLGAAFGHIYQIHTLHNFNPGNAGTILWTDILIPVFLWIALIGAKKNKPYGFLPPAE
jgi:hypothetical protein